MAYTHSTGTRIMTYNSHKEHCFYDNTTKRQMHLIIEQMSGLLKSQNQDWVDRAIQERDALKANGIK
jgi:hypothetical protein